MKVIWSATKAILKTRISETGFLLWIEPLAAETGPQGELMLVAPNAFAQRWVKTHYLPLIQHALGELGQPPVVKLAAAQAAKHLPAAATPAQPALPLAPRTRTGGRALMRGFTFERFVEGPSNRLAFHASAALARNDTFLNGILFLAAAPGLGKSHLSQAVGNFLADTAPRSPVLYVTAEDFTNDMVRSLKSGQMPAFKERYRGECDILLMEEVQFLSGKEKIQAELCYTLDTLLSKRKRCVFTSHYLPGEIAHLSRELRSRLTGGLITPIAPPDLPTRRQILARRAEERGVSAGPRVLEYVAENLTGDVRLLESALDCLAARATLLGEPPNLSLAQEVLQDLKAVEPRLSVSQIQKLIGDFFQVSVTDLLGKSRQRKLVRARQAALYFARLYTHKTMVELGRLFHRSHASVVHALQTLERDRQTHPRVARELRLLEEKMAGLQVRQAERGTSTPRSDA